jgi:ornithine cyclodeaminase
VLGILGSGAQARLEAVLHAAVLPLERVVVWGRSPERAEACRREIAASLPRVEVRAAESPAAVAREARVVVTATASRAPLLSNADIHAGTLVLAVGSDSAGKQELDPAILRRAGLLLVDSVAQCERLGELQHVADQKGRAVELGAFCASPTAVDSDAVAVCDFTGLGIEDLAIAELAYGRLTSGSTATG